ncbi:MAG: DMT family transporter [Vicinamibacterales bacterium]
MSVGTAPQYTWPAFAVVWSAILLRDRVNVRILRSLGIGILAVWVGARTSDVSSQAAARLPLVLVVAAMFGLYSALTKKFDYEPLPSLAWTFGAATLMAWVAMMVMSSPIQRLDQTAVQSVVINGTLVNGLSYVWWQRALRAAPVTFVAPWISLVPLLAAVFTAARPRQAPPIQGSRWCSSRFCWQRFRCDGQDGRGDGAATGVQCRESLSGAVNDRRALWGTSRTGRIIRRTGHPSTGGSP